MPLSPPSEREPVHTRQIVCQGYRRKDGLWDIEGHFLDTKHHEYRTADDHMLPPGAPLHQMLLRVTIDDELTIRQVEAITEDGPSRSCFEIHDAYRQLEGLKIGPGFNRKIRELFGGTRGCTHFSELLPPIAATALQTLSQRYRRDVQQQAALRQGGKPALVDSCHAFRADGPVVKRLWPASYTGG